MPGGSWWARNACAQLRRSPPRRRLPTQHSREGHPVTSATLTSETVLEVKDLGVDFWVDGVFYPAAIGLNYSVKRGEVLAIVGESGSGKSSSSMALLGLLPPNAKVTGSIQLLGRELRGI